MGRPKPPRRPVGQTVPCGWCRQPIHVRATGRIAKWCSQACRSRAWQQRRAAASGLTAVEVVDRVIKVEKEVHVVEYVDQPATPVGTAWAPALLELAMQIDAGRLYDRDLATLADALNEVLAALGRRPAWGRIRR